MSQLLIVSSASTDGINHVWRVGAEKAAGPALGNTAQASRALRVWEAGNSRKPPSSWAFSKELAFGLALEGWSRFSSLKPLHPLSLGVGGAGWCRIQIQGGTTGVRVVGKSLTPPWKTPHLPEPLGTTPWAAWTQT